MIAKQLTEEIKSSVSMRFRIGGFDVVCTYRVQRN